MSNKVIYDGERFKRDLETLPMPDVNLVSSQEDYGQMYEIVLTKSIF